LLNITKIHCKRINPVFANKFKQFYALMKIPNVNDGAESEKRFLHSWSLEPRREITVSPIENMVHVIFGLVSSPISVLVWRRRAKGKDGSFIAAAMNHETARTAY